MRTVVEEVKVRSIPFTDAAGERWDLCSGPDLYCELYGPAGDLLYESEVVTDVRPSDLPLSMDAGFALTESGPHILRVLDADFSGDERVGRVAFEPERLAAAGQGPEPPPCVQFEDGETTLWVALRWEEAPG